MLLSEQIIRLFRGEDAMVVSIGTGALRMQLVTLPLWGFYVMSNMCTQSIGYGFSSTVISSARQGIFLIPSVLILPALLGITGLQAAQPAADVLAFILAAVIMHRVLKKLGDMEESMDIPVGKD